MWKPILSPWAVQKPVSDWSFAPRPHLPSPWAGGWGKQKPRRQGNKRGHTHHEEAHRRSCSRDWETRSPWRRRQGASPEVRQAEWKRECGCVDSREGLTHGKSLCTGLRAETCRGCRSSLGRPGSGTQCCRGSEKPAELREGGAGAGRRGCWEKEGGSHLLQGGSLVWALAVWSHKSACVKRHVTRGREINTSSVFLCVGT